MPHPNASKGARWERWCAAFLGVPRTLSKGKHDDKGDLEDPAFVYEAKDDASRSPMQWWEQAEAARQRADKPWAVVLSKVRLPKPGQPKGWAQMSIEQWKELRYYIRELERVAKHSGCLDLLRSEFGSRFGARMADDEMPIPRRQASQRQSEPAA